MTVQKLSIDQKWFLKDVNRIWSQRDQLNLSCKTSAVFELFNSDTCYKVYGNEIDEVVLAFLKEEENE